LHLRWIVGGVFTYSVMLLAFYSWVFGASEAHLHSFDPPPAFTYPIPDGPEAISRGDHLVRTRGCRGCHGENLEGKLMWEYAVAPNLVEYARSESASTMEAAIRHGIGRGGRALYSMPSYNFVHLSDADLADIIASLRSAEVVHKPLPDPSLPWAVRLEIALGNDAAIPAFLDRVPALKHAEDVNPEIARGEYIAMTTCNECHGFGLRADTPWDDETAPDLIIIGAYDEASFRKLMRTGIAIGERELRLMSHVARSRFAYFTDQEIAQLYAFLRDMSDRAGRTE
jgi:mono/diheme cytochrome c family protein